MSSLSVAIWVAQPVLVEAVRSALQSLAVRIVQESAELRDVAIPAAELQRLRPDVLLLELSCLGQPLEDVIRTAKAASPESMIVALHTAPDSSAILSAMRAGAAEFLFPPLNDGLRQALERRSEQVSQSSSSGGRGRVLGVLAAKGGCGATTLACHLAAEIGRLGQPRRHSTLLIDLDLDTGIVGFIMKSKSPYSVQDAANNLHRLDSSYWKGLISNGWPGLEVITAPSSNGLRHGISQEHIREVLAFARSQYQWIVADLGRGLTELTVAAAQETDELLLVTTLEVPAMHRAKQAVQGLFNHGYDRGRIRLVLNRSPQAGGDLSAGEIERILGLPIDTMLPNDYTALDECYCEGRLLPPVSNLGRQIGRLALKLAGIPEEKGRRRFMLFG